MCFKNHSEYFGWSEKDRALELKNNLAGTAAHALWTGGKHATCEDLIQILQSRHGTKKQAEKFGSELTPRLEFRVNPHRICVTIYAE